MCSAAVDFSQKIFAAIAHETFHRLSSMNSRPAASKFSCGSGTSSDTLGRNPERPRCSEGIDRPSLPPGDLVSVAMDVTVMNSAQGHGELVAHLQPHRPRLGKSEVVGVGWASSADQTRLRRHEFEMGFITQSTWLAEGELALVDLGGSYIGLLMH